jgi:hypothetical protein
VTVAHPIPGRRTRVLGMHQVVEHMGGGDCRAAEQGRELHHVRDSENASAPVPNHPFAHEYFKGVDRLLNGTRPRQCSR